MTNQTDGLDAAGVAASKLENMLQKWETDRYKGSMLPGTQMTCDKAAAAIRSAIVDAPAGETANPEDKIRRAFKLFADARTVLTALEFTEFVRNNLAGMPDGLGGQGFVASIGKMISDGASPALASPAPDVAELKGENERLRRALKNLAYEMRHMLRANPEKDGGLYRQRLDEADAELSATFEECPHNCNEGGICLAEHSGYPKSCPVSTRNAGT